MPTYQYVCETCDDDFEVVQSFSDPSLTVHEPGCGGPVRKRFNAVGVVFKGTGFYRNDSRGKSTSSESSGSSGSSSSSSDSSSSSSSSSSESKPAAASTPAPAPSSTPAA